MQDLAGGAFLLRLHEASVLPEAARTLEQPGPVAECTEPSRGLLCAVGVVSSSDFATGDEEGRLRRKVGEVPHSPDSRQHWRELRGREGWEGGERGRRGRDWREMRRI